MQNVGVVRINGVLFHLQPVAVKHQAFARHVLDAGDLKAIEHGKGRNALGRSHIDKHDAAEDVGRIRPLARFTAQAIGRRFTGHVHDRAINVEFPPVVAAPDPLFGQDPEFERRVAMATAQMQHTDPALEIPEHNEVFAQRPRPQRNVAELADIADRVPEAALVLTARRAAADFL